MEVVLKTLRRLVPHMLHYVWPMGINVTAAPHAQFNIPIKKMVAEIV
jgi:hypothetical protein